MIWIFTSKSWKKTIDTIPKGLEALHTDNPRHIFFLKDAAYQANQLWETLAFKIMRTSSLSLLKPKLGVLIDLSVKSTQNINKSSITVTSVPFCSESNKYVALVFVENLRLWCNFRCSYLGCIQSKKLKHYIINQYLIKTKGSPFLALVFNWILQLFFKMSYSSLRRNNFQGSFWFQKVCNEICCPWTKFH